jgi:hypothetical protein
VVRRRLGYVRKDASLESYVVFETLACEPGEVDGGVDADRFEACAGVAGWWELGFVEDAELVVVTS